MEQGKIDKVIELTSKREIYTKTLEVLKNEDVCFIAQNGDTGKRWLDCDLCIDLDKYQRMMIAEVEEKLVQIKKELEEL